MLIFLALLYLGASGCTARPSEEIDLQNVIVVPPNCPAGEELVNGICRPVWKAVTVAPANIITVPMNCPPGQEYINGQCREVWLRSANKQDTYGEVQDIETSFGDSRNIISVPPNCPPGQELVNGQCRDVWIRSPLNSLRTNLERKERQTEDTEVFEGGDEFNTRNIVNVPNQCPVGYRPDALGICRPIL